MGVMRAWASDWVRLVRTDGSIDPRARDRLLRSVPALFESSVRHAFWWLDRAAALDGIDLASTFPNRGDRLDAIGVRSDVERRARYGAKTLRNRVEREFEVRLRSKQIQSIAREFAKEQASLIKDLSKKHKARIATITRKALEHGWTQKQIGAEIRSATGITVRRARSIGADQVARLNAKLTKRLAQDYGSKAYRWITLLDDRVRALHQERHAKRYSWNHSHSDGHPGEPVNCRCIAQPTFDQRTRARRAR